MKLFLLLFCLLLSNPTLSCTKLKDEGLDNSQIMTLRQAFEFGRQNDLSYTLAAIAWKESNAGKYLVNLQDPSAGVFHISIKNAIKYYGIKDTNFNRNRVAQMLINDFTLSAEYAIINLKFWIDKWGDNWNNIWAAYNAGYNVKAGKSYSKDIKMKIATLSECGW